MAKTMHFGTALDALINGPSSCTRKGWATENGKKEIKLQVPDANSANTEPYFYMLITGPADGLQRRVPWSPSNADLLAKDWQIL